MKLCNILFLLVCFIFLTTNASAATITSANSGNWNNGATWVGGVAPNASDDAVIAAGHVVTLTASATIQNITVNPGGTLAIGSNTLDATGNITGGGSVTLSSGTINIGGNWARTGSFTAGTSTVVCNGSGAQTITATTFNNLTINKPAGTATLVGNLTVGGNLNIAGGTLDAATFTANRATAGGSMSIAANCTVKVGGTNTLPSNYGAYSLNSSSLVEYYGANQTVYNNNTGTTNIPYGHLRLTGSGTKIAGDDGNTNNWTFTVNGDLYIGTGVTFDIGTNPLFINFNGNVTIDGTLDGYIANNYIDVVNMNGPAWTNNGIFKQSVASGFGQQPFINFNGTTIGGTVTPQQFYMMKISGTVSAGVDIAIISPISSDSGALVINAGATLNMGTHVLNLSAIGTSAFSNSGTFTSSGTVNFAPSAFSLIKIKGTAFTSSGTVSFGGTGPITLTDAGSQSWTDVTISNTNVAGITPPSAWNISGSITIGSGATFKGSTFTHSIGGNWTNNGTYLPGTGTITLSGSSIQSIQGATPTTFRNLAVATSGGSVNADTTVVIQTLLTLASGTMSLGSHNLLIETTGSVSGGSASSYIETNGAGRLFQVVSSAGLVNFPIGTSGSYTPVAFKTETGTDTFSVRVINGVSPSSTNDAAAIQRTWDVSENTAGGNGTITMNFQWNGPDEGPSFTRSSAVSLRHNGTSWIEDGIVTGLMGSDPYVVADSGISTLGRFTLGDPGILPIQLSLFTGDVTRSGEVLLEWTTLSEINNMGFYAERRQNRSTQFVVVSELIAGAGTTLDEQHYTWNDVHVPEGAYVYRLRMVDNQGDVTYSYEIHVSVGAVLGIGDEAAPLEFRLAQNYPNPFNPTTKIKYQLKEGALTTLKVYNLLGIEVATLVNEYKSPGRYSSVWDASDLSSGMYICHLRSGANIQIRRMILMR